MALDGKEICSIIETCAKNSVFSLEYGLLKVSFGVKPLAPEPTNSVHPPENIIQAQKKEEILALEKDEVQTREDYLAELLITNPLEAERLMESGELGEEEQDAGPEDTEPDEST